MRVLNLVHPVGEIIIFCKSEYRQICGHEKVHHVVNKLGGIIKIKPIRKSNFLMYLLGYGHAPKVRCCIVAVTINLFLRIG